MRTLLVPGSRTLQVRPCPPRFLIDTALARSVTRVGPAQKVDGACAVAKYSTKARGLKSASSPSPDATCQPVREPQQSRQDEVSVAALSDSKGALAPRNWVRSPIKSSRSPETRQLPTKAHEAVPPGVKRARRHASMSSSRGAMSLDQPHSGNVRPCKPHGHCTYA